MGLGFYDEDGGTLFSTDPLRTFHDGRLGGPHEVQVWIANNNPNHYYTNISLEPEMLVGEDWEEFGITGWGIKLLYGERRPTLAEWDTVRSGDDIPLPDIGDEDGADTSTYHPIWVRVSCPGGESAQIRENIRLLLTFNSVMVP